MRIQWTRFNQIQLNMYLRSVNPIWYKCEASFSHIDVKLILMSVDFFKRQVMLITHLLLFVFMLYLLSMLKYSFHKCSLQYPNSKHSAYIYRLKIALGGTWKHSHSSFQVKQQKICPQRELLSVMVLGKFMSHSLTFISYSNSCFQESWLIRAC